MSARRLQQVPNYAPGDFRRQAKMSSHRSRRGLGSCREPPGAAGSCREPSGASQESGQEPARAVRSHRREPSGATFGPLWGSEI